MDGEMKKTECPRCRQTLLCDTDSPKQHWYWCRNARCRYLVEKENVGEDLFTEKQLGKLLESLGKAFKKHKEPLSSIFKPLDMYKLFLDKGLKKVALERFIKAYNTKEGDEGYGLPPYAIFRLTATAPLKYNPYARTFVADVLVDASRAFIKENK